jgi:hypothetical protein
MVPEIRVRLLAELAGRKIPHQIEQPERKKLKAASMAPANLSLPPGAIVKRGAPEERAPRFFGVHSLGSAECIRNEPLASAAIIVVRATRRHKFGRSTLDKCIAVPNFASN